MPAEIVWEDGGPVFVLSGVTTYAELRAMEEEFYRDPRSDRTRWKIVDLRTVERLVVTEEEVTLLAAFHVGQSKLTPDVKQALVAPQGRFGEEGEVFLDAMGGSSWETRRFADMKEARAWAGAPAAQPD